LPAGLKLHTIYNLYLSYDNNDNDVCSSSEAVGSNFSSQFFLSKSKAEKEQQQQQQDSKREPGNRFPQPRTNSNTTK
jgi:hypothetical protein